MSKAEPLICLYLDNVTDLPKTIDTARKSAYNRIVSRVKCPQLGFNSGADINGNKTKVFTRSDLLLNGIEWRQNNIMKIGEAGDCDSRDKKIRNDSQQSLKEEINWAKHLDSIASVIVTLNNEESFNLVRQLMDSFDDYGNVLVEMSIVDKTFFTQKYSQIKQNKVSISTASTMVWKRWNRFRLATEFNRNFNVALELTTELPSECEISRWHGEPVEMVILSSEMFESININQNNQICLKEYYRNVCQEFWIQTQADFAIRCTSDDPWLNYYPICLRKVLFNCCTTIKHECNRLDRCGLKLPLTPSHSVNNCSKYHQKMLSVFSTAIRLAIEDRFQINDKISLMICGANGWKLLEPVMTIVNNSDAVQVFIFDEDPCAAISICETITHLYADKMTRVTLLPNIQMKKYFKQMDIVISITFEAIYEHQWLQFNFDRVREYIRPDAILIPKQSTLSIVPVTAALTYCYLHDGIFGFRRRWPQLNGMENYITRAQTICPLYTRNVYECSTGQQLFSFNHQFSCNERNIDISMDSRLKRIEFKIDRDCIVTGFAGYFLCALYKDITFNNRLLMNSCNKNCVPMAYFPLKTPQTLSRFDALKTVFWLHSNNVQYKYWYEWHTTAPIPTPVQNLNGNASTLHPYSINSFLK